MRLLTRARHKEEEELGVNNQGITEPLEVKQKPRFGGLRYTEGEFSKVPDSSKTLLKSSRKYNGGNTSPSSHGSFHCRERAEVRSHQHTYTRDRKGRYKHSRYSNVHFSYNHVVNDERKTWHRKTCTICGLHNHTFPKCWKIIAAHNRMRRERTSQQKTKKHVKHISKKKMYCSYCNRGGHQRATCCRLHPEQLLEDKVLIHEPDEMIV